MKLYIHKYYPKRLNDFIMHKDICKLLTNYIKNVELFQPMIIYGGHGIGKYSIAKAMIADMYNNDNVHNIIIQQEEYQESKNKFTYNYFKSKYHIEIDPSIYNNNDHLVISDIITPIIETKKMDNKYIIIIIKNADKLTSIAQEIIRIKSYNKKIRFILLCETISKLITTLKSRYIMIRIKNQSETSIIKLLNHIIKKESLNITKTNIKDIIIRSTNIFGCINIKECINRLQIMYSNGKYIKYRFMEERCYDNLINIITKNNIINNLHIGIFDNIREIIYTLLINQVSVCRTIKYIQLKLFKYLDDQNSDQNNKLNDNIKTSIIELSSYIDYMAVNGTTTVFYLENYIYNLIKILNTDPNNLYVKDTIE